MTLIEVLISITLMAVISFLVWQAMGTSTASKERFEKREETFQGAALALDRMSRDLQMAVLFSKVDLLGVSPSGEQQTKSVFIGSNNGDQDKLTFETFSHLRYLKDTKESDLAEVSYYLDASDEAGSTGPYLLKKRESSPPDAEPEEGGVSQILLEGVKELNLRYYDPQKNEYVDAWNSTGLDNVNRLPRAVEISLVVQDPLEEDREVRLSTVALIEMAPGPNDF